MELRAYRALRAAGATWADIAREAGCDWRTAKKYLAEDAPATPPVVTGRAHPPRLIEPWAATIDGWLAKEPRLQASVIHKRLVADHAFPGSYQRVKLYVGEARERTCPPSARAIPTLRSAPRGPGPGGPGRRGHPRDRVGPGPRLQLPHDVEPQP